MKKRFGLWTLDFGLWICELKRLNLNLKVVLFSSLLVYGCNNTDKKQEYIRAEIKLNVENYKKKRHIECIQAAYDSANRIVDSLIFKQNLMMDSSSQIVKPVKPAKINLKATIDTAAVKPIIEK